MKENTYNTFEDMVTEIGQSITVKRSGEWILVYRTSLQSPDIFNDLKSALALLDREDVRYLNSVLLMGAKKSVKMDSKLIEDLVGDRTPSTEIIDRMREELDGDFGCRLFERGPHKRLAVRIPIHDIKDFVDGYTPKIKDAIMQKAHLTPDGIDNIFSVYLIADDSYVRLEPEQFFQEIFGLDIKIPEKKTAPSNTIILGESPQELVELAIKKLKKYKIYRDIEVVEASGIPFDFDALAVKDSDRILIKYIDELKNEDMISLRLFMGVLSAGHGWILTSKPVEQLQTEDISILTIKDL